jgi:ribosomal protein L12E/L44/L45/RPP1/RPP2
LTSSCREARKQAARLSRTGDLRERDEAVDGEEEEEEDGEKNEEDGSGMVSLFDKLQGKYVAIKQAMIEL